MISVDLAHAEYVRSFGRGHDIHAIPNFVDTDFIRPLPKVNPFSERHSLANKFVVTHAGNLGYVYDLDSGLVRMVVPPAQPRPAQQAER